MAVSIVTVKRNIVGNQREWVGDVTFDNSYLTGGEPFIPDDVDPAYNVAASVFHFVVANNILGYKVVYDYAAKTLVVHQGDNANVAAAPGIQVPNATNLSTLVCRVLARYGAPS